MGFDVSTLYKKKADKLKSVNRTNTRGGERLVGKSDINGKDYTQVLSPRKRIRLTPERVEKMKVGQDLTVEEKGVFLKVLFTREAAITFNSTEKGRFSDDIEPPHIIPTISHTPWQAKNFKIAKHRKEKLSRS